MVVFRGGTGGKSWGELRAVVPFAIYPLMNIGVPGRVPTCTIKEFQSTCVSVIRRCGSVTNDCFLQDSRYSRDWRKDNPIADSSCDKNGQHTTACCSEVIVAGRSELEFQDRFAASHVDFRLILEISPSNTIQKFNHYIYIYVCTKPPPTTSSIPRTFRQGSLMDIILDFADHLILDCWWWRTFPMHSDSLEIPYSTVFLPSLSTTMTVQNQLNESAIVFNIDDQRCSSRFARDHLFRQSVSIYIISMIGILCLYLFLST
jgi:hypothetical protein